MKWRPLPDLIQQLTYETNANHFLRNDFTKMFDGFQSKSGAAGFHVWVAGEVPPGVELRIHVAKLLRAVEKDSVLQEYRNMLVSHITVKEWSDYVVDVHEDAIMDCSMTRAF